VGLRQNWSTTTIKEVGDRFHKNFTTKLKAHPVNLGYGTKIQWEAKTRAIVQMRIKRHVATRVQQPLSQ
jgi:hypothetical protein